GQTTKYKVSDGVFRTSIPDGEEFENQRLKEGDRILVIPFRQNNASNSPRKFGYAIVTPAISQNGDIVNNSYRTVSVLSDGEIDKLKEKPETERVYNDIVSNESRDIGFVSIDYSDINDPNGFTTSSSKSIDILHEGVVSFSQPIKYIFGDKYRDMNKS